MKNQKNTKNKIDYNRIHVHVSDDEVAAYRKKEQKHDKHIHPVVILVLIWIGVFICSLFFVIPHDDWNYSLAYVMDYASTNIKNFYNFLLGAGDGGNIDAFFYRLLVVACAGAALATCGAAFQGSFRNILAGPSSMGVMSGGSLGMMIYVVFFYYTGSSGVTEATLAAYGAAGVWQLYQEQFLVLAGCFGGTGLIMLVSIVAGRGKLSSRSMLITGMVFSGVISNITMVIQYFMIAKDANDPRIEAIRDLTMGSFDELGSPLVLAMVGIPVVCCLVILIAISGKLNLMSLGTDEALTSGVNVYRYRNIMLILSTVMTAVVMAFCGRVGFVGFMVPLVARRIVGPDMRKLIPVSIFTGAIILTLIFDLARILDLTDSMNLVTSAIGCVVMVITLMRRKKGGDAHATNQRAGAPYLGL